MCLALNDAEGNKYDLYVHTRRINPVGLGLRGTGCARDASTSFAETHDVVMSKQRNCPGNYKWRCVVQPSRPSSVRAV